MQNKNQINAFNNVLLGAPSEGAQMVFILKRRIMNELMTTYLPTVLILIIVYTTNFFKAFFFEAVVTVNLTALLVLTTLFISVSGQVQGIYRKGLFRRKDLLFCV